MPRRASNHVHQASHVGSLRFPRRLRHGRTASNPRSGSEELINFSLLDYKGRYYELRRVDARAVVLFFTGNGCPVARQSIEKLKVAAKTLFRIRASSFG